MGKTKVGGMGASKSGKITSPKVTGKGGLKIEGGFKAMGTGKSGKK